MTSSSFRLSILKSFVCLSSMIPIRLVMVARGSGLGSRVVRLFNRDNSAPIADILVAKGWIIFSIVDEIPPWMTAMVSIAQKVFISSLVSSEITPVGRCKPECRRINPVYDYLSAD